MRSCRSFWFLPHAARQHCLPYSPWVAQGLATLAGPFPLLPDRVAFSGKLSVALCYLPCVVMVLMRPNEGQIPVVIETTFERLAGWWRTTITGARGGVPVAQDADGAEAGS